ncbi:MAG: alpha/beta hydrolase-fold protein [bacterium]
MAWSFIQQVKWRGGTPLRDSTHVVFLAWNQHPLSVVGMITQWQPEPMKRVYSTPLQYLTLEAPFDARFEYVLTTEYMDNFRDPLNNDYWANEDRGRSIVRMPGWHDATCAFRRENVPRGKIDTLTVFSLSLGYERTVLVYQPPDYHPSRIRPYPLLLAGDGRAAVLGGQMTTVLDNLIADGKIDPPIVVFISTDDARRWREYGGRREWRQFVTLELLPLISDWYHITAQREQTAIFGVSRGGLMAVDLALHESDRFGLLAAFSPALDDERSAIIAAYQQAETFTVHTYVCLGYFEKGNSPEVERWLDVLRTRDCSVRYHQGNDGHSWVYWRSELEPMLTWFFPPVAETENMLQEAR